jgi:hypothetical protein
MIRLAVLDPQPRGFGVGCRTAEILECNVLRNDGIMNRYTDEVQFMIRLQILDSHSIRMSPSVESGNQIVNFSIYALGSNQQHHYVTMIQRTSKS